MPTHEVSMSTITNVKATIIHLPAELIDRTSTYLDVYDIANARLTCRNLCAKFTGHVFKSFFAQRSVETSRMSHLRSIVDLAKHPVLGPAVQTLTISAVTYDDTELKEIASTRKRRVIEHSGPIFMSTQVDVSKKDLEDVKSQLQTLQDWKNEQERVKQEQMDVGLLTEALSQLKGVSGITLDAMVYEDSKLKHQPFDTRTWGEWGQIWGSASHAYLVTMAAIARSQAPIERLDVFGGIWRCSLALDKLALSVAQLNVGSLRHSLAGLRVLSLSLSDPVPESRSGVETAETTSHEEILNGLAQLLSFTPELEELDLHNYRFIGTEKFSDKIFDRVGDTVLLHKLVKCKINGLNFTEQSLVRFLRNCPSLTELDLRRMRLTAGSWGPIFDFITGKANDGFEPDTERASIDPQPNLEHLRLQELFSQVGRPLKFDPDVDNTFSRAFSSLDLNKEQLENLRGKEISFSNYGGRPPGSPRLYRKHQELRREYGPP
jgi:hypothetical protein